MAHTGTQNNWFEKNPKKTIFTITLLGIFVVLALVEVGARIFMPGWSPTRPDRVNFWVYDDQLGWAHKKGQKGHFDHRDFSINVYINSDGFRDSEYPLPKTGKKRMLVIGDSFGWGYGVEHNEIFCEIIEQNHPHWEVINASVSGYGTDQQLLFLRERGLEYQPDVVLLLFSKNDFQNNISKEQYWYYKPIFVLKESPNDGPE